MDYGYRKDLSHLTWDEVLARQELRGELATEWLQGLEVRPGDAVADIGSGPGYVSLLLAEKVGAGGWVFAVDRSADALAYLARVQEKRGIENITRIVRDAASLDPESLQPHSVLIAMVLHHANEPEAILHSAAGVLRSGSRAVIAEFHPEGPAEQGPPTSERLSPERVQGWCEQAGFTALSYRRQTPEHYMLVLQRT